MKADNIVRPDDYLTAQEQRAYGVSETLRDTGPTRRTRVYIAGPITSSGNLLLNVRKALLVGTDLLKRGYAPYVPHLTCYWEIVAPEEFTYEDWLGLDMEYLSTCDAFLRLPGTSKGADREMEFARQHGLHIYLSTEMLYACEPTVRRILTAPGA